MLQVQVTREHEDELDRLKTEFTRAKETDSDTLPPALTPMLQNLTLDLLISCVTQAVQDYETWYNDNRSLIGIGVWNRHGQAGQLRANKFKTDILKCQNLDAVLTTIVAYFNDPKIRFDENSFSQFFLTSLRNFPFLMKLLDFGYLQNRYNTSSGSFNEFYDLKINECDDKQAFTALTLLQNQPNPLSLLKLKECFTKAFLAYLKHTNHPYNASTNLVLAYDATVLIGYSLLLAPFTYGISLIPGAAVGGVAYWVATRRGVITTHGKPGVTKASALEIAIADSYSITEIIAAIKKYFSDEHGFGNRTNSNRHSFIAFLLEELKQNSDVVATLNTHIFNPRGENLNLKRYINYHGDSIALKTAFDIFMSLSRDSELRSER